MQMIAAVLALMLALLPAGRAQAFVHACTEPVYLTYFGLTVEPQPCTELGRAEVVSAPGRSTMRLMHLTGIPPGRDLTGFLAAFEQLSVALGPAFDGIATARPARHVTLLLAPEALVDPLDGEIQAAATGMIGQECTVVIYKVSTTARTEDLMFTLAHELFHCAQYATWLPQMADGVDEWWSESSAEYFAHLALPGYNTRSGWFGAFDRNALTQSLPQMSYENVVFFLWLATEGGPEAVGSFLGAMRLGDQTAVLRSLVTPEAWTRFIEAWNDGRIQLPGGFPLAAPVATLTDHRFSGPMTVSLPTQAFAIPRWGLIFPEGKRFSLTLDPADAPPDVRMREDGTSGWAPPPATVNTCDGEKTHLIFAATTEGNASASLDVDTDDDSSGEDSSGGACCLVGAWSPTQETLDGFATTAMQIGAGPLAAAGAGMSCAYASGGWVLTFDEAGTGTLDYQANTSTCSVSGAGGGTMRFEESRSGVIGFDWQVVAEGAGMATYTENTLAWSIEIHIGPMVQNQGGPDAGPSIRSNGFAFTCEADSLAIRGLYGVSTAEATYLRFAD